MAKKFKVIIPEEGLTKEQIELIGNKELSIKWFVDNQGKVFDLNTVFHFPDFLLEEIKQPMTYKEIEKIVLDIRGLKWCNENDKASTKFLLERMHNMTIENERLKHKPKQSFEEWWEYDDGKNESDCERSVAEFIWQACDKNRGYNE